MDQRIHPDPDGTGYDHLAGTPLVDPQLGAHHDAVARVWRFALWSPRADSVLLVLVARTAPDRAALVLQMEEVDGLWRAEVPEFELVRADGHVVDLYGFRVSGRVAPLAGHRFDESKVLLDPYATRVFVPPGADRDLCRIRGLDTLGRAPLAVLERASGPGQDSIEPTPRPERLDDQLVILELHVRHATRSPSSGVREAHRGTFAGLIDRLDHVAALGVTAVELLPVHAADPGEGSWWGYMPLAYLALEDRYAAGGDAAIELAELADELHARGMELILDVVYNHTTEEDHLGPTYSLRGIDNAAYYVLTDVGEYRDDAGCGNIVCAAHPAAQDLILTSLQRLVDLGVDGFRFDLATVLGRDAAGEVQVRSPTLDLITAWAAERNVRLIAEAWDVTAYQVGDAFPGRGWAQWNGPYRDVVRSFVKGDGGLVDELCRRVQGSPDLFPDSPSRSVNFVTAHDGFTLYDLVSYQTKRNEPNGHGNTDGADDNRSWNCGHEGDLDVPDDVLALRHRQMRNLLTILLCSGGVPMLLGGDDMARTQRGNNNAYNLDDETVWFDWDRLDEHADLHRFVAELVSFRRSHPSLGRTSHWGDDVEFFGPVGADEWRGPDGRCVGWVLRGGSVGDDDIVVLLNAHWASVEMPLPDGAWARVVDTVLPPPGDIADLGAPVAISTPTYWLSPRSAVVLVADPLAAQQVDAQADAGAGGSEPGVPSGGHDSGPTDESGDSSDEGEVASSAQADDDLAHVLDRQSNPE